jgi:hypothetical protein
MHAPRNADVMSARVSVRWASSIEGGDNNPSDGDARSIDAAWIGLGRVLQAAEDDCYESANSDPSADHILRAHIRGLPSSSNIGQKRQMI